MHLTNAKTAHLGRGVGGFFFLFLLAGLAHRARLHSHFERSHSDSEVWPGSTVQREMVSQFGIRSGWHTHLGVLGFGTN